MFGRNFGRVDWSLRVGVGLLVVGAFLPWVTQQTATLGLVSQVSTLAPLPSRFVVLGFALGTLAARRAGGDPRTETALLTATAFSAIALPGLHLIAANANRGVPTWEYYATGIGLFAFVALLTCRFQSASGERERVGLVLVWFAGTVFLGAVFRETHVSPEVIYAPGVGFYATVLAAPVFGAAAAFRYARTTAPVPTPRDTRQSDG